MVSSTITQYTVGLRRRFPGQRILIAKFDFSDDYRRVAYSPKFAVEQILVLDDITYVMLHLVGRSNP